MKTFGLFFSLLLVALTLVSCMPYQGRIMFSFTYTPELTGSGGLMQILADQSVDYLISPVNIIFRRQTGMLWAPRPRINLPSSQGYVMLRYDPPQAEGTYRTLDQWYVDGRLRQQNGRNFDGFGYGFEGNGDHIIRLITNYAWAGDRHSAGADTLEVFIHAWRDVN